MKKRGFTIVFIILFIAILFFQYNRNYKFRINPPSNKWAKEVSVGTIDGKVKTYPKMLEYDNDSYLLAYQNGKSIDVNVMDKKGKKINGISIEVGDDFIRNLSFVGNAEKAYLYWTSSTGGVRALQSVQIDKKLNIIGKTQEKNINECNQIGNNILIITYANKIVIRDIEKNKDITNNIKNAALVTGTTTNKGNIIAFHQDGKYFKYFFIKDGVVSPTYLALTLSPDSKGGYFDRTVIGADNNNAYLLIEAKSGEDRYGIVKCLAFSLDGTKHEIRDLRIGGSKRIFGTVSISSGEEARFVASGTRYYERRALQEDIIDFSIKDDKIVNHSYASRTNQPSLYPAMVKNNLVFMNYINSEKYDIYMTSSNDAFKTDFNTVRSDEIKRAMFDTLMGFIYSLVFIFLIAIRWILFGITSISGVSYFCHNISEKTKKVLFSICYGILVYIKVDTIYSFYKKGVFPNNLNSPIVVIGICLILSLLCFVYGYKEYSKNIEALPLGSYLKAMLMDTILTQMIFIPFIY